MLTEFFSEQLTIFYLCVLCLTMRLLQSIKVRHVMDALIMTYSRPLIQASYEVILHQSTIWLQQKLFSMKGIELGTFLLNQRN